MQRKRESYAQRLSALDRPQWEGFLRENSGLPGPRANLELLDAVVDVGDASIFDALIATDDEYLLSCGVVGLGQVLAEATGLGGPAQRLHGFASDKRWRVREAVAMALQRLGDADPGRLRRLTEQWAADADPLVQRAAVAGVCEPRLLDTPASRAHALALCQAVTDSFAARPPEQRRTAANRTLRQALGYCWSVAVAADPAAGLPRFTVLSGQADPDLQWIVRENRRKARLARLMDE